MPVEDVWLTNRRLAMIGSIATAGLVAIAVSRWHPSGVIVGALAASVVWAPVCAAIRLLAARRRYERERLLRRLSGVSDVERRRIAGEVHDGVLQDLIGISFSVEAMAARCATGDPVTAHATADRLRGAIDDLRSLLLAMYPVEVPAGGWTRGFDDLIDDLGAAGVAVELDLRARRWTGMHELLALRVTREALRNVRAHSSATQVTIASRTAGGYAHLVIVDDGVGFDAEQADRRARDGHFGLRLTRDLACEVGASLTIDSAPGGGTRIELIMKESR